MKALDFTVVLTKSYQRFSRRRQITVPPLLVLRKSTCEPTNRLRIDGMRDLPALRFVPAPGDIITAPMALMPRARCAS
jgi:hypothetical protein